MATNTKMTALDLPWHMVIDMVSHELGFAGRDVYDIIIEAEKAEGHAPRPHTERDHTPEDLMLDQT